MSVKLQFVLVIAVVVLLAALLGSENWWVIWSLAAVAGGVWGRSLPPEQGREFLQMLRLRSK